MKNYEIKKGFTLVELLVAVGLFSVVAVISVGGFTTALRTQRQAAALIGVQSNADLALEQMAREVRTGYLFCDVPGNTESNPAPNPACASPHCTIDNGGVWTCDLLNFNKANGTEVRYSLVDGVIMRSSADNGSTPTPITGENVLVRSLSFIIAGNYEGDHWNPRITISMSVSPNSGDPAFQNSSLDLQTTLSAREIDCNPAGGPGSC